MKKIDVHQAVFDAFPKHMRDAAMRQAADELDAMPRHMLDEGNPNHPMYDDKIFGYDVKEFMAKQH